MSTLTLLGVTRSFGRITALAGTDLTVPSGTLAAILGPSGCGKTTLLRCIAGFEQLDAGEIRIDGRTVAGPSSHTPPHRRRVAVVPQEGALFPHLTVAGNVGYGLSRTTRRRSGAGTGRIHDMLNLVGLAGYGNRMPHELSGGQQQRVAVARALAPNPRLVLLDEPFSSLDAGLRTSLRQDIRAALRATGATAILVTHDQAEALSVADEIAVMREGRIVQNGPPAAVYAAPADPWVAAFVGDAVLLHAHIDDTAIGGTKAHTPLGIVPLASRPAPWPESSPGNFVVMVRPEQIRLDHPAINGVSGTVEEHRFHGHDTLVTLRLADGTLVTARVQGSAPRTAVGDTIGLSVVGSVVAYPNRQRPPRDDNR